MIRFSPFEAQGNASYFCAKTRQGLKRCAAGDTDANGNAGKGDTLKMERGLNNEKEIPNELTIIRRSGGRSRRN